jgi:spermidine synthase
MNRQGFLLGFFSTGAQVLLLRELVSSLNGSELFIGTALFGWLIAVATGAYLGGRANVNAKSPALFGIGALLLPTLIITTRLSPLLATNVVGEIIPFSTATIISIMVTLPVGLLSGWLFTAILKSYRTDAGLIMRLYFVEGIGAGVAGIVITLLVGAVLSTLAMAAAITLVVLLGIVVASRGWRSARDGPVLAVALAAIVLAAILAPRMDRAIDGMKYGSYRVISSLDTPYSHQAILTRDSTVVLVTDNTVEAVEPNLITAENLLLPPFAYKPEAKRVLVFGRTEFGIEQLAGRLADIELTAVDPRRVLSLETKVSSPNIQVTRVTDDPLAFVLRGGAEQRFDVIIVNPGDFGSFRGSRLVTERFLRAARQLLSPDGIFYLPTQYDSDRYVTSRESRLLAVIHNTLRNAFRQVEVWPGNMTLFFASDRAAFNIPYDSLISNLSRLTYVPQYINDNYLFDRLSDFKKERLLGAVGSSWEVNSQNRPVLTHYQTLYRAKLRNLDSRFASLLLEKRWWYAAVPILILALLIATIIRNRRRRSYGLFLYFVAGLISLSLEMISFYVYQTQAGSLYSELAVLIGVFMFGLSAGAYATYKTKAKHADVCALLMLSAATLIFAATYQSVPTAMLLIYHLLFLLTVALGTGSLFAAATRRYYELDPARNRGAGYAFELVGSAVGAILPTTVFLPTIGLTWLLVSVLLILASAIVGCLLTLRQQRLTPSGQADG